MWGAILICKCSQNHVFFPCVQTREEVSWKLSLFKWSLLWLRVTGKRIKCMQPVTHLDYLFLCLHFFFLFRFVSELLDLVKHFVLMFTSLVFMSRFRLDVYIHDYLLKRKLHASAKAFMTEGKVATDPVGKIVGYSSQCCSLPHLHFTMN